MAEESRVYELEGLEKQLQSLLSRYSSDDLRADGGPFCSDFCKLVEEYASRWQVPLPQLRILEIALCYFARASTFFSSNCDRVLYTLSSLALSVFELLLFFDQRDFHQEPLKHFTVTFQECHLALAKHQNVHLLQVERLVRGGGPWAIAALQAILSESSLPQNEVDGCISSELPVFFELRVRYLLSCERISEAMALAKCCAQHPTAGQHLFFLQVYLTWLYKTSQHDCLQREVADFNGKDAVHIICSLECEEKDEVLLALSTAFLSQQLRRGDMYYLCELVFVWTKLYSRLNTSNLALLEECHQLMLSATNVNSIFPFIRAILQEVGEDGIQFCVELCANAMESCLPCDVITKSLIYKTIAGLLPNDLEVCRACALLVFFLERTVESYKIVYLLYMHPDQEYHVEYSPIANNVRFETLQVLKKDLYFDPEFWNLIALRTNCVKLMSEKVVSAALEEIMEDKWISNYCTKEPAVRSVCHKRSKSALQAAAKKRHHKEDMESASKRLKSGPGRPRLNVDHTVKKKGSRHLKEASSEPLRRSFWQLDRIQDNAARGELRRTTRLSEKNPPKRRIRRPRWLLEDSGTLEENNVPLKMKKHHRSSIMRRSETGQIKINAKPAVNSHLKERENNNKYQKEYASDCPKPASVPQIILELSLPDNELMGSFHEDTGNRHRGLPQVLFYKPTVKLPSTSPPVKTVHRKEVILRARDPAMFVQQLHCYARRQKGKGNGSTIHGSVSTITRSSVQGSPPKDLPGENAAEIKGGITTRTTAAAAKDAESTVSDKVLRKTPARELSEKSAVEMKVTVASQRPAAAKVPKSPVSHKIPQTQSTGKVSENISLARELAEKSAAEVTQAPNLDEVLQAQTTTGESCEEPAVEMKVTIASQSPVLDKVSKAAAVEDVSKVDKNQKKVTDEIPPVSNGSNSIAADPAPTQIQDVALPDGEQEHSSQAEGGKNPTPVSNTVSKMDLTKVSAKDSKEHVPCKNDTSSGRKSLSKTSETPADQSSMSDISALTLVTEMVTELTPLDLDNDKQRAPGNSISKDSRVGSKPKVPHKIRSTSSCSAPEKEASVVDVQENKGKERICDMSSDTPEDEDFLEPETEESKLEYCCTFCNKVFKGSRVVAHAMFHYRKDECMFCGTMFKDDLLAMMHLSDHIEKLKRLKELAENKTQENISDTKATSTAKTSAKAKTANMSSRCRSKGRPRKLSISCNSVSLPDLNQFESRKLRSNDKPEDEKQDASKHLNSKTAVPKVNGHIGKKREDNGSKKESKQEPEQQKISRRRRSIGAVNPRLQENQDVEMDSSAASAQAYKEFATSTVKETLQTLKTITKQNGKVAEEKNVEPPEKVCCPVDDCSWFTDLSKNRVALLYHALDDHHGDPKPLELAFRVGNSRCSICMRVLWSFEHFQHHVERHRHTPRHPCLHQGCAARFKTGMEMRRHTRKHNPLQAVCCLPGCSELFICLWALNLHEREHYASKSTKPDKSTDVQTSHDNTPAGKKQQHQSSEDTNAPATVVKKTESVKAARKLRQQVSRDSPARKHVKAPPLSTGRASLIKQELKEKNESKDSNVLKNLSNKDTSAQPAVHNLRLRQTLRKVTTLAAPKIHKVISSSLLRHSSKVRHKLKKKQVKVNTKGPKRRGRPPKLNKAVHDENTTAGRNSEAVKEKAALQNDQKNSVQPPPAESVKDATVSKKVKEEEEESEQVQDVVQTTEMSTNKAKSKKSTGKQIKRSLVKQKGTSHKTSSSNSSEQPQKSNATKIKKLHKIKNPPAPSDCSKKHKIVNGKVNKTNRVPGVRSALNKPANSKTAVPQVEATAATVASESSADDEGKVKVENTDPVLSDPAKNLNAAPTTENIQKVKKEKSKKLHIKKEGKNIASANSKKKHKDSNKKNKDKKSDKEKVKSKKSVSSKVQQQDEVKGAAAEEGKGEASTLAGSGSTTPDLGSILNENTCLPTAPEEKKQKVAAEKEKPKKPNVTKNSDPGKANKRKDINTDDSMKIVKKQCKDDSDPSVSMKPETEDQPVTEVKETPVETPLSAVSGPGYSLINGQVPHDHVKSTLARYSKKPYMRLPPTAYLDEKYITMPKRRKEMSLFQPSERSPPPEHRSATAAPQRQRCANCFATFTGPEELQTHLQLQKCSNLFGFDSDDEDNM